MVAARWAARQAKDFAEADRLRDAIGSADPRDSDVPVVSNVDAKPHHLGADWTSLLSAQLSSPVRWRQSLLTLEAEGVTDFAELGALLLTSRTASVLRATLASCRS